MKQLINQLDNIFVKKAPFQLPESAKEWIVKYGPWITLVVLILLLPAVLLALGLSAAFLPFAGLAGARAASGLAFAWVFLAGTVVLEAAALPGLFARKKHGWNLLFYGVILNAVYSLLSFQVFNLLIGTAISLYFLMQIRSKYS